MVAQGRAIPLNAAAEEAMPETMTLPDLPPPGAPFDDAALARIEAAADAVLDRVGVAVPDNREARERFEAAGALVRGEQVHFPPGLARQLASGAPRRFVQIARNPERNVTIGGRPVYAPLHGAVMVRDIEGVRRFATIDDFRDLVRLAQVAPALNHVGSSLCEPSMMPSATRHLDMLEALIGLSDKPFLGYAASPEQASDSLEMCRIVFGEEALRDSVPLMSVISLNSPLTFDRAVIGVLDVLAGAGQGCILTPYMVMGLLGPSTVAGALVQILAEVMAAAAYAQLVRAGTPVLLGAFAAPIDPTTGSPVFGRPEGIQTLCGAGQLARRLGMPFRASGALTASRLPDAQAGYESAACLWASHLAGSDFTLHCCGALEGALIASFQKFIMDAKALEVHRAAVEGLEEIDADAAVARITEVGPGGHFLSEESPPEGLGWWKDRVMDPRTFERWEAGGAHDTAARAAQEAKRWLAQASTPELPASVSDRLAAYVAERKAEIDAGPY